MPAPLFKELAQRESCFLPGNTLCRGCMESIAFSNIGKATDNGKKTIYTMGTYCGEVSTLFWPNVIAWGRGETPPETFEKSFGIIHNVFESAPTVAEAIRDVADTLYASGAMKQQVNVVSNSGDGGALAIGLRPFLHTIYRRSRVTLVVMINEFYANTGFQYGPATSYYADTSTTPVGKESTGNPRWPLNHIGLAMLAGAKYVAQVSPAFPKDFAEAMTKAMECDETAVIFVPAPCITGWKYDEGRTIELARLGAKAGLFPVFMKERGQKGGLRHVDPTERRRTTLLEFMAAQRRYGHIVRTDKETGKPKITPNGEPLIANIEAATETHLKGLEKLSEMD